MYDITTGTGDFIANGVVSHNCFARPTHEYLGLDPAATSTEDRREGQRGGAAAGELLAAPVGRAPHRDGHEHRPVPARRGQVPADARDHRGARRARQPVLDPHQVARSSSATSTCSSRPRAHRRAGQPLDRHARRATCGGRPSPARRTRAGGSRRSPRSTRPASRAACSSRRSCPGSPTGRTSSRRWRRRASRPARCRSRRSCSTCARA